MPRTPKPSERKKFDWEADTYRSFREWEISLPERGTQLWDELVVLLMERPDIHNDEWPIELIVNALISDAERHGDVAHDFGYRYYDHQAGEARFRILARAVRVLADSETVYDPKYYRVALEGIEP